MFIIVAKTATLYGVVDTNDNYVEWVDVDQIRGYVNSGVTINGVMPDGSIEVNPAYCADYRTLLFGNTTDVFTATKSIRVGNRGNVEFVVGRKIYKVRLLSKTPVVAGSTYQIGGYLLQCPTNGYLVKMSNGICTILPEDIFTKFAKYFR